MYPTVVVYICTNDRAVVEASVVPTSLLITTCIHLVGEKL